MSFYEGLINFYDFLWLFIKFQMIFMTFEKWLWYNMNFDGGLSLSHGISYNFCDNLWFFMTLRNLHDFSLHFQNFKRFLWLFKTYNTSFYESLWLFHDIWYNFWDHLWLFWRFHAVSEFFMTIQNNFGNFSLIYDCLICLCNISLNFKQFLWHFKEI